MNSNIQYRLAVSTDYITRLFSTLNWLQKRRFTSAGGRRCPVVSLRALASKVSRPASTQSESGRERQKEAIPIRNNHNRTNSDRKEALLSETNEQNLTENDRKEALLSETNRIRLRMAGRKALSETIWIRLRTTGRKHYPKQTEKDGEWQEASITIRNKQN